ncbi:hypothetical protein [Pedobacter caeni]|uniref:Uncharacterized protein n=1 Tax=Pedobacter caeni TaxID=288992 RepID=A0A1M4TP68_9SPHI|nr:hypothetical protein [Pedobacter caeni]SHE46233.1 hypothetical protein SAMN04488522_101266 [Pedobacter caeni]
MRSQDLEKSRQFIDLESYYRIEKLRVAKNYNRAKHRGFTDKNDFADWFIDQLEAYNCKCFYCETSIHEIKRLIDAGLLKQRNTRFGHRGKILEVDKNDNDYTKEQCVLSCYYCNNDKSYTSDKDDYKEHFGANRHIYFRGLIDKLNANNV